MLLTLYAILIFRIISIGLQSRSYFGKLFCYGFASSIFIYIAVNMSMVLGLLPIVGVPLPFFSYGGSALLTSMTAIGLIISCHVHRDVFIGRFSDEET